MKEAHETTGFLLFTDGLIQLHEDELQEGRFNHTQVGSREVCTRANLITCGLANDVAVLK